MLAQVGQEQKSSAWHLPNLGKSKKVLHGICPTWARAKKFCMAFAQVGQGLKKSAWRLPKLGKHWKVLHDVCPSWARDEKVCMTFAQVGQGLKSSVWRLLGPQQGRRKIAELLILLQKWRSVFTKLFFEAEKASRTCTDKIYTFIQITRKTSWSK